MAVASRNWLTLEQEGAMLGERIASMQGKRTNQRVLPVQDGSP